MSARVPVLGVVIGVAACVKVPAFEYQDAATGSTDATDGMGSSSDVRAVAGTTNNVVYGALSNGLYRMEFSQEAYRYPVSFIVAGTELLAPVPAGTNCGSEHGAGVALYPTALFTSRLDGRSTPVAPATTPVIRGPGIAKVALTWAATLADADCGPSVTGRSSYTFFPDGRITRMDVVELSSDAVNTVCSCYTTNNLEVTTYHTFDRAVISAPSGVTLPDPNMDGSNTTPQETSCIQGADPNGYRLGVGWFGNSNRRYRQIGAASVAMIADMTQARPTIQGGMTYDTISTLWAARGGECADVRTRVEPHTQYTRLLIDDGSGAVPIGIGQDGMYGGETSGASGGREPATGTIVLGAYNAGEVPAFALWLDLTNHPGTPTVTRSSGTLEAGHFVQDVDGRPGHKLFWFPAGLTGTETITIMAPP